MTELIIDFSAKWDTSTILLPIEILSKRFFFFRKDKERITKILKST